MTNKVPDNMMITPAVAFKHAFMSANQNTPTGAGALAVAHGLGAVPSLAQAYLLNITPELGYSAGDHAVLGTASLATDGVNVTFLSSAALVVLNKSTGASTAVTPANWKLVLLAWV